MFQTVHVVSIEDVTTRLGDFSFHEKLVNGAPVLLFWTLLCYTNKRVSAEQLWRLQWATTNRSGSNAYTIAES